MGANISVKVKAKGKKATDLIKTLNGMPDSSGSNYVSFNQLHVPSGAATSPKTNASPNTTSTGTRGASEREPYKPRPGWQGKSIATETLIGDVKYKMGREPVGDETRQIDEIAGGEILGAKPKTTGFGPSFVGEDINTVKPCPRDLNPVERARQKNNRTRDMRTNLGRGKPAVPEID